MFRMQILYHTILPMSKRFVRENMAELPFSVTQNCESGDRADGDADKVADQIVHIKASAAK